MTTTRPSTIGILGGIFNPVHNGHLAIAQMAVEQFSLSRVVFVPSGTPPHKEPSTIVAAHHRLEMLRLATRTNNAFEIWDEEIRRGGVSYTIDTLESLEKRYPSATLYFIIGSDNLKEIAAWRNCRKILEKIVLCVAHRPGHAMTIPENLATGRIQRCRSPEWGCGSTMVRTLLAKKHSCRYLVPAEVENYIRTHHLY